MYKRKHTDVVETDRRPFGDPFVLALGVIAGPDVDSIHRLIKAETKIGRALEADFVLQDPRISSVHICIHVNGTLYSLEDLGSTNGTLINQKQVSKGTRVRLKHLDEIQIGRTKMLFMANRFRTDPTNPQI